MSARRALGLAALAGGAAGSTTAPWATAAPNPSAATANPSNHTLHRRRHRPYLLLPPTPTTRQRAAALPASSVLLPCMPRPANPHRPARHLPHGCLRHAAAQAAAHLLSVAPRVVPIWPRIARVHRVHHAPTSTMPARWAPSPSNSCAVLPLPSQTPPPVNDAPQGLQRQDGEWVELTNGCMCCAVKSDFLQASVCLSAAVG